MPDRSDLELIEAVREGDLEAAGELHTRHFSAAVAYATQFADHARAQDLASEAFTKLLAQLGEGRGPETAFRSYLFTTIRNLNIDLHRRSRETPTPDFAGSSLDEAVGDGTDDRAEAQTVLQAFSSLPERWRAVLWHTAVEGDSLEVVAEKLGMNPNSVAALSFRAREGLRQAYLAQHMSATWSAEACERIAPQLPRFVRGGARRDEVAAHLETCPRCSTAVTELDMINTNLKALLVPAVAGAKVAGGFAPAWWSAKAAKLAALAVAGTAAVVTPFLLGGGDPPRPEVLPPVEMPAQPVEPTRPPLHPRATSRPSASPSPTPTPGVPTERPRPQPTTPRPAPAVTPPAPRVYDVRLGAPAQQPIGSDGRWQHVVFPIDSATGDLTLTLRIDGVTRYQVHRQTEYGDWVCRPDGTPDSAGVTLTCALAEDGPRSRDLGIDVQLASTPLRLSILVVPTDGSDPSTGDNVAAVTLPAEQNSSGP
ncbi:sigma-70 family RNA polymerase sigma factor [Marmoricola sp. RAF53]|uniref:sigma-70 family RNA polymerase sigma factor n=1 Tax=Marmoricola sp. RAF53 TaxID=3233059 RepID=UPI003F9B8BC6